LTILRTHYQLLAAAKSTLVMFERQQKRKQDELNALESLRIALDRLKEDTLMYETLLTTIVTSEAHNQSVISFCDRYVDLIFSSIP
jgi:hypothetical protein